MSSDSNKEGQYPPPQWENQPPRGAYPLPQQALNYRVRTACPAINQEINDRSLIQRARDHRTRSHTQTLLFLPREKWSPYRRRNISNIQSYIDIRSTTCIPDILRTLIEVLHSNI